MKKNVQYSCKENLFHYKVHCLQEQILVSIMKAGHMKIFKKNITSLNLDSETTEKLYKAICTNPGNFLSAGIGYMEIYELHKEAKDTMNDKYDE